MKKFLPTMLMGMIIIFTTSNIKAVLLTEENEMAAEENKKNILEALDKIQCDKLNAFVAFIKSKGSHTLYFSPLGKDTKEVINLYNKLSDLIDYIIKKEYSYR